MLLLNKGADTECSELRNYGKEGHVSKVVFLLNSM